MTTVTASHPGKETEDSVSLGTRNDVTDVKESEASKRREPIVVFNGHYDTEDKLPEELLPEFVTMDYLILILKSHQLHRCRK